jgi:hypothetical protein
MVMQYALLCYETRDDFAAREDPSRSAAYWDGWMAYGSALKQAGVFVSGAGFLPPDSGTGVQVKNDKRTVHDGPYADSKEQLGGFYVIDVPDLDAALGWAAKCPSSAGGMTEVRPLLAPRRGND